MVITPSRVLPFAASLVASLLPAQETRAPAPPPEGYEPELGQRAWRIHHDALVIDTHSDTTTRILADSSSHPPRSTGVARLHHHS